jgi:hypothetical protein
MKRLLLILAVVCLFAAIPSQAQLTPAYGNITASGSTCATANACVTLHLPSPMVGNVSIQLSGTFTLTGQFEQSPDNQATWDGLSCNPQPSGVAVSSATAADLWVCAVAGVTDVRVRGSAYTSGTAAVVIQPSNTSIAGAVTPPTGTSATQVQGSQAESSTTIPNPFVIAGRRTTDSFIRVPDVNQFDQFVVAQATLSTAPADGAANTVNYAGGSEDNTPAYFRIRQEFQNAANTWDGARAIRDATDSTGTGIQAVGLTAQLDETSPSAVTENQFANLHIDSRRYLYVRNDAFAPFNCVVAVSTATTIQAVGGSCIAPGAGLSLYITDIEFGSSAASGTAADSFPTLKSGTTGTCGTGTAVIWQALSTANSTVVANLSQPIKVAANSEVCWIMSTAGSKTIQLHGYIAP